MLYAGLDLSRQRVDVHVLDEGGRTVEVLAELSRRDLVPAIWLPDPTVRAERERARFRLHLVRHRIALKNRIHATLIAFGHPVPVSDLFGAKPRARAGRGGADARRRWVAPGPVTCRRRSAPSARPADRDPTAA